MPSPSSAAVLCFHFSNRLEVLLQALHTQLRQPASVFEAPQIIVPSAALRHAVTLHLADTDGVCAQVRFDFLAQWLWRQIGRTVPGVAAQSPFTPQHLVWRIYDILGDAGYTALHPRLQRYLSQGDDPMRFDLALRCATLIEQTLSYRPDWVAAWSAGQLIGDGAPDATPQPAADETARRWTTDELEDQRWQAALWRRLSADLQLPAEHPVDAYTRAIESAGAADDLPALHLFCLPALPPLYLSLLARLARTVDLHVYLINPCREYWFDLVGPRRLAHLRLARRAAFQDIGHALLADWGRQTQAQIGRVIDAAGDASSDEGHYAPNPAHTLLARLQNGILDLVELTPASVQMADDDRSMEVHVCHTLTRELEALHNRLLGLFDGPVPPQPSDILVALPDLAAAAPLIDAVFGTVPAERRIPYVITGRPPSKVNAPARVLLDLLALGTSRHAAGDVYDLIQQPVVRRRHRIDDDALDALHTALRDADIRWGLDAAHQHSHDLHGAERYSFDAGLTRLLLGYTLPDAAGAAYAGSIAAGQLEGSDAEVLGLIAQLIDRLRVQQRQLAQAHDADGWLALLQQLLADWIAPSDGDVDALRAVNAAIVELCAQMRAANLQAPVPADVLRSALTALLDDPVRGGVRSGAVTFCAISSLRHIPARHVCVIGLSDRAFPTAQRAPEFDLLARHPRPGDRQRRDDERNQFLDLLLAARDSVYLSYTGRSVRDDAVQPPSVLISQLLDVLVPAIADDASSEALARARERLVIVHPLQPFAPAQFQPGGETRIASYDAEYAKALQSHAASDGNTDAADTDEPAPDSVGAIDEDDIEIDDAERAVPDDPRAGPPFFIVPLAAPDAPWRSVTIEQLVAFLHHPCRYLLRERLGIAAAGDAAALEDDEPLVPGRSERKAFGERLLPQWLEQSAPAYDAAALATLRETARAGTEFPDGPYGAALRDAELDRLLRYADGLAPLLAEPCLPPLHTALQIDLPNAGGDERWELTGTLPDVRTSGLVRWRYDDISARDRLSAWVAHLCLQAAAPGGVQPQTIWLARDGRCVFGPVDDAKAVLGELVALYRAGLTEPLHFFPKSALDYMRKGLNAARGTWYANARRPWGEEAHVAYRLALRGRGNVLDDRFTTCAERVYRPLLNSLIEDVKP